LKDLSARPLDGTGGSPLMPFFSPDGNWMSSIIPKRIYLNTCRIRRLNIIAPQAQMTSSQ
jgi:hypothetical protein